MKSLFSVSAVVLTFTMPAMAGLTKQQLLSRASAAGAEIYESILKNAERAGLRQSKITDDSIILLSQKPDLKNIPTGPGTLEQVIVQRDGTVTKLSVEVPLDSGKVRSMELYQVAQPPKKGDPNLVSVVKKYDDKQVTEQIQIAKLADGTSLRKTTRTQVSFGDTSDTTASLSLENPRLIQLTEGVKVPGKVEKDFYKGSIELPAEVKGQLVEIRTDGKNVVSFKTDQGFEGTFNYERQLLDGDKKQIKLTLTARQLVGIDDLKAKVDSIPSRTAHSAPVRGMEVKSAY